MSPILALTAVLLVAVPIHADEAAAVKALTKTGAKIKRDDKAPGTPSSRSICPKRSSPTKRWRCWRPWSICGC
jgi:hypothetical protein